MKTCEDCGKRGGCKELCAMMERTVSLEVIPEWMLVDSGNMLSCSGKSRRRLVREMYYLDGWSVQYIAKHFSMSERQVRRELEKVKELIERE